MKNTRILLAFLIVIQTPILSWSKKNNEASGHKETQVLIVGLNDNVKSNYYYNDLITEETGIVADSIDQQYNHIIAENIASSSSKSLCKFIAGSDNPDYGALVDKIDVSGEGEQCSSSLSRITEDELQKVLESADATYLLVLNQHYLKWQQQPMRTLFHIVSYTLYDKNKNKVVTGNQYFTCMNLQKPEKLVQLSRKSSSKIASSVTKSLNL